MAPVSNTTASLIRELEELQTRGYLPLEKRLVDTAVWFHKNKDRFPRENLPARVDFLEKTMDIFLEMMALSVSRLQEAEGRGKSEHLWLPAGMTMNGDPRKLG